MRAQLPRQSTYPSGFGLCFLCGMCGVGLNVSRTFDMHLVCKLRRMIQLMLIFKNCTFQLEAVSTQNMWLRYLNIASWVFTFHACSNRFQTSKRFRVFEWPYFLKGQLGVYETAQFGAQSVLNHRLFHCMWLWASVVLLFLELFPTRFLLIVVVKRANIKILIVNFIAAQWSEISHPTTSNSSKHKEQLTVL